MARTTFSGPVASTNGFIPTSAVAIDVTPAAAITAAQLATGKITSTSAAAVAITLPAAATVGTVQGLVPAVNAVAGQTLDFQIDTQAAGAGTVTVALGAGGALSALATAVGASAGLLVVAAGNTGTATFRLTFTGGNTAATFTANIPDQPNQGLPGSATGYTLTRIA